VFAADFRLAPEFPAPAATDDVLAVLAALHPQQLFLAGDSAGGGLVGSVLNALSLLRRPGPTGVVLFSPEVSLVPFEPSVPMNAKLDILPWNLPSSAYLAGTDANDASVSLLHEDLTTWPPTFLSYGADEVFRDPIRSFVKRLDSAGVVHEAHEVSGMFHVFPFLLPWAGESRQVYLQVGAFLDRLMTPMSR
jgi:monoterpene epsilon-lactone hydrolase